MKIFGETLEEFSCTNFLRNQITDDLLGEFLLERLLRNPGKNRVGTPRGIPVGTPTDILGGALTRISGEAP